MEVQTNNFYNKTFKRIYEEVYTHMSQEIIDVFLCGGASTSQNKSVRDVLRESLDKNKNIRILYPEDLFIEMLNIDKNHDLLTLERFLADNCDFVCIVCESAGSLVELGAFTNNENTVNKVIALIEKERRKQKSFIMLGPVKILEKQGEERVIFYGKDLSNTSEELVKAFKKANKHQIKTGKKKNYKPLNTMIGLHYFISIILFFYSQVESQTLIQSLKYIFKEEHYDVKDFNNLFRPTLKLLYKEKYITESTVDGKSFYSLTDNGYKKVSEILGKIRISNRNKLYDGIRFSIINNDYYRSS